LTIRESEPDLRRLQARARPLIARARAELITEGASARAIENELWADMRYLGQSYELEVKLGPGFIDNFHQAHRRHFGHSAPHAPLEVVNLRLRAHAGGPPLKPQRVRRRANPVALSRAQVLVGNSYRSVPVYERDTLGAGSHLNGPMIIVELSSTAYVSPEFTLRCDDHGNLHLETR
jgi:N-methylhydantoinase A